MPRVRRTVQDHAAVREVGGVMDDWCYSIHEELAAQDRAERVAAVTAAVLRALELAAELGVVRVGGVVGRPPATGVRERGRLRGCTQE